MTRRQCAVYNIPPASTARGHCTDDWKGKKMLIGYVQVYSLGLKGGIFRILNPNLSLFAEGKFNKMWEQTIDRCYDSARYFAVQVQNQSGQRATVGLGFDERNDAFDFVGAFTKYKEQIEILQNPDKYLGQTKQQDFSLKSGEKISLSFDVGTQFGGSKSYKSSSGGGLKKLTSPPKVGGGLTKPPSASFAPPPTAQATHFQQQPAASFQPPAASLQQPIQTFQPIKQPAQTFTQQQQPSSGSLYAANWTATTNPSSQPESSWGISDGFSSGSAPQAAPAGYSAPASKQGSVNLIDLD